MSRYASEQDLHKCHDNTSEEWTQSRLLVSVWLACQLISRQVPAEDATCMGLLPCSSRRPNFRKRKRVSVYAVMKQSEHVLF
jgi:hypothetical protein